MCAQGNASGTEDFLQWPQGEVHVQYIEWLLLFVLHQCLVAFAVVTLHGAAELPVVVLLGGEHERRCNVYLADFRPHHIAAGCRVVVGGSDHVHRCVEVVGKFVCKEFLVVAWHCGKHRQWQGRCRIGGRGVGCRRGPAVVAGAVLSPRT